MEPEPAVLSVGDSAADIIMETYRLRDEIARLRSELLSLANHVILVGGVTPHEVRRALFAISAGRSWRR